MRELSAATIEREINSPPLVTESIAVTNEVNLQNLSYSKNFEYSDKIDHLRFLAAAMIVYLHTVPWMVAGFHQVPADFNLLNPIIRMMHVPLAFKAIIFGGETAVTLFMTLSGFLFARITAGKELNYQNFILNRILRIYPLFATILLLAVYLAPPQNTLTALATSFLLLQNCSGAVSHPYLTPQLWSVSVEFQFYLIFPLLASMFNKSGHKALWAALGLLTILRCLVLASTGELSHLSYFTIFGRLDQFIVGMMLGYRYRQVSPKLKSPAWLGLCSLSLVAALSMFYSQKSGLPHNKQWIWLFWPFLNSALWGSIILTYCSSSFRFPATISRLLAYGGSISFSIYMLHLFCGHLTATICCDLLHKIAALDGTLGSVATTLLHNDFWGPLLLCTVVSLPTTIGVSILTYHLIEKPFMDMRVKYLRLPAHHD